MLGEIQYCHFKLMVLRWEAGGKYGSLRLKKKIFFSNLFLVCSSRSPTFYIWWNNQMFILLHTGKHKFALCMIVAIVIIVIIDTVSLILILIFFLFLASQIHLVKISCLSMSTVHFHSSSLHFLTLHSTYSGTFFLSSCQMSIIYTKHFCSFSNI